LYLEPNAKKLQEKVLYKFKIRRHKSGKQEYVIVRLFYFICSLSPFIFEFLQNGVESSTRSESSRETVLGNPLIGGSVRCLVVVVVARCMFFIE
jgi:hypothetical protein